MSVICVGIMLDGFRMMRATITAGNALRAWDLRKMAKAPAFQFYADDWVRATRILTPEEKGVWIDFLSFAFMENEQGRVSGSWEDFGRLFGVSAIDAERIIGSIVKKCVCDISVTHNGCITVMSRRMSRDAKAKKNNRMRQQRHRESRQSNATITPPSSSPSPIPSPKEIKASVHDDPIPLIWKDYETTVLAHYGKQYSLTKNRRAKIRARLKDGFTFEQFQHVHKAVVANDWVERPENCELEKLYPNTERFEHWLNCTTESHAKHKPGTPKSLQVAEDKYANVGKKVRVGRPDK